MWKWLTNAGHRPRHEDDDAWAHPAIGNMDLRQLADLPFPRPSGSANEGERDTAKPPAPQPTGS